MEPFAHRPVLSFDWTREEKRNAMWKMYEEEAARERWWADLAVLNDVRISESKLAAFYETIRAPKDWAEPQRGIVVP